MTSPLGGEIWIVGTQHLVTWNSTGAIKQIRLEYSADHFQTILPGVMSTNNQGKYLWTVPDSISSDVLIRVSDIENPEIFSQSEKPIEIRGAMTLLSPAGGETWQVGTRHAISWDTVGTIAQVRLEYSSDDFTSDSQIIMPALANKGIYYWEVPPITNPEIKIRVTDTSNPEVYDISRSALKLAGELALLFPNWGEGFQVGERIDIKWRATPNISNVKLEYSNDDFQTTEVISEYVPNSGKFTWNIPNVTSDSMRIRVSDAANKTVFSFSQIPFRVKGALKWLLPKGGEVWSVGSAQVLGWKTLGNIPRVRVEYSWDDFKTSLPIAANIENTGTYRWSIPEVPHADIRFRVSDAAIPSVEGQSETSVHIVGSLEIISPTGGERWVAGEDRMIRWRSEGFIPKANLEYSKDDFDRDIHLIVADTPNVGNFLWHVPNDISDQVRVRVQASEDKKITSSMGTPFKIDYFKVRWVVRDAKTGEDLMGMSLSDSTGKTQASLRSPVNLEYPYGIFTTMWTKPGYADFRSTWLADKDQTFSVAMESQTSNIEMVRSNFDYDRDKDLMKVTLWYEKEGKPVAAVIQSEVRVYEGQNLLKTLTSSNPDSGGYFHMIWDTSHAAGNTRYLASATVTLATGKDMTSPIGFQLDLPVKEKKEPMVQRHVTSLFLKPLGLIQSESKTPEPVAKPQKTEAPSTKKEPVSSKTEATPEFFGTTQEDIIVPRSAVFNETISIGFKGSPDSDPVIDIYDANRKLIIRGHKMKSTQTAGEFSYLLPIKGIAFIAGKSITVSVIDKRTKYFKSAQVLIESSPSALGLDKQLGALTVISVAERLDRLVMQVKEDKVRDSSEMLNTFEVILSELYNMLNEESLNPSMIEKLNRAADVLASLAQRKGYDAAFLVEKPLPSNAGMEEVNEKMHRFRDAIAMLERLNYYSAGRSGS